MQGVPTPPPARAPISLCLPSFLSGVLLPSPLAWAPLFLSGVPLAGLLVFVASAAVLSLVSVTLQKGQQGMASIGVEAAVMLGVAVAVFLMHALGVVGVFYALVVALLPAHRILERHEQMSTRGALTQVSTTLDVHAS